MMRMRADMSAARCRIAELGFSVEAGFWTYKMLRPDKVRKYVCKYKSRNQNHSVISLLSLSCHSSCMYHIDGSQLFHHGVYDHVGTSGRH